MKEISDKFKGEIAHVMCDMITCGDRGEYPRCYLHIFDQCARYEKKVLKTYNSIHNKEEKTHGR